MKLRTFFCLAGALSITLGLAACKCDKKTIHIIGDSTMADYEESTTQIRGWGEMLGQFVPKDIIVKNHAIPGRSTRSFYAEGSWEKVLAEIKTGDYVVIQFAHNDEKEKGKDGADGRGTAPWTTYKQYLGKYIDETREAGATPILFEPIVRRYFSGNNLTEKGRHNLGEAGDTSLDYVAAMRSVGKEKDVPVVNFTDKTCDIVEAYGPTDSKECLFVQADNTHTRAMGATIFAMAAADALDSLGVWDGKLPRKEMLFNPTEYDFGEVFIGDTASVCFDIVALQNIDIRKGAYLTKEATTTVKAPRGFLLSHSLSGEKKDTLVVNLKSGASLFAHFAPQRDMICEGLVKTDDKGNKASIMLKGMGKVVSQIDSAYVRWSDNNKRPRCKNAIGQRSIVKGLTATTEGYTIESGTWPADIDEDGNRFLQVRVNAKDRDMTIKQISLKTSGDFCYRISYAKGNDFFLRSTIGERQHANGEGLVSETYKCNIRVPKEEMVIIRIFPWSKTEREGGTFEAKDIEIEGVVVK